MSPAHVLEPTYRRLKRGLMEGMWPQGSKLEALKLADEFGVSMTPVRDSLNRLAGENLVELQPGEGYRVPWLSERLLRDLLDVSALLLVSAVRMSHGTAPAAEGQSGGAGHADRTAAFFARIAGRSGNTVLAQLVDALGERLHVVRRVEPLVLAGTGHELEALGTLFSDRDPALAAALRSYHQRRRMHASDLVASLASPSC
jgi:DNA-binding FadR family transcriptional regulator